MAWVDTIETIRNQIETDWNSSNTSSLTPMVKKAVDIKRQDLYGVANRDLIVVYDIQTTSTPDGLGTTGIHFDIELSIDIRTTKSHTHLVDLVNEVQRIINNNLVNIDANHHIIDLIRGKDLSDKTTRLYRFVQDIRVRRLAVARNL